MNSLHLKEIRLLLCGKRGAPTTLCSPSLSRSSKTSINHKAVRPPAPWMVTQDLLMHASFLSRKIQKLSKQNIVQKRHANIFNLSQNSVSRACVYNMYLRFCDGFGATKKRELNRGNAIASGRTSQQ